MNSRPGFKPSTSQQNCWDARFDVVLAYIDNSNIFINTQKYAARQLQFKYGVTQDIRSRVDVGKLVDLAKRGRTLIRGKLYGSEPPALDTVWKSIRRKDIEVSHSKRSSWNSREKMTDTEFVAEAVEDIIEYKDQTTGNSSVILFTGDKDMLPVVRAALRHGWKVEIWSYKNALSDELDKEKDKSEKVQVHLIDDYFHQFAFWAYHWGRILPRDRTVICSFQNPRNDSKAKELLEFVMKESSKLFELPTIGRFLDENNTELAIFPTMPSNCDFKGKMIKYDFNRDVFAKAQKLKSIIKCKDISTLVKSIQDYNFGGDEEEKSCGEKDENEDETDMTEFITVYRKERKKKQLYSDHCIYQYRCHKGKNCKYEHSVLEKEYFKERPKVGTSCKYKSVLCAHFESCKNKD